MNSEPWSFNQPVLLNKTRRNSSVLVWTLVGTTVFATGWAFLAPLPETVAVQGKLQPSSPVRDIEAPLPGVVEAVLVEEGQAVLSGETLVRFDPRDVRSRLRAATINRDGLRNQLAINKVLLGEQPNDELTANQRALLRSSSQKDQDSRTSDAESLRRTKVRLEGYRQSLQTAITIAELYRRLFRDGAARKRRMRSRMYPRSCSH